jgi:hypothetical protein
MTAASRTRTSFSSNSHPPAHGTRRTGAPGWFLPGQNCPVFLCTRSTSFFFFFSFKFFSSLFFSFFSKEILQTQFEIFSAPISTRHSSLVSQFRLTPTKRFGVQNPHGEYCIYCTLASRFFLDLKKMPRRPGEPAPGEYERLLQASSARGAKTTRGGARPSRGGPGGPSGAGAGAGGVTPGIVTAVLQDPVSVIGGKVKTVRGAHRRALELLEKGFEMTDKVGVFIYLFYLFSFFHSYMVFASAFQGIRFGLRGSRF